MASPGDVVFFDSLVWHAGGSNQTDNYSIYIDNFNVFWTLLRIKKGSKNVLKLGNLYAKRDWGYAKEFVYAMWLIMQKKKPDDYVISTSKSYTVKEFINLVCQELRIKIVWKGKGYNEAAFLGNKKIISIDKKYFRPTEVNSLRGNFYKAKKHLKWKPKTDLKKLVKIMVNNEFEELKLRNFL